MSANNYKDLGQKGEDRRARFGDRRDDDEDARGNDAGAIKSAGSRPTPKATTDRRSEGAARPDRFAREPSKFRRFHIWGATALIVVAVSLATAELSGGYVSGFVTGQPTGSNYKVARLKNGSNLPSTVQTAPRQSRAQTPSNRSTGGVSGPAPGTSLARAMAVKEPTRAVGEVDTSSCPPMPKVAIWGNLTHQRVINYVERRHAGDWAEYLDKWNKQARKIKDIFDRGSAVRIGKNKIKIEGKQLAEYADQVRQRADINRCLAKLMSSTDS